MTTYRERREKRAERLEGWAGSRAADADAAFGRAHEIADGIPFGQPILVGHHSEGRARRDQARIVSSMAAGVESSRMADRHAERAQNVREQLGESIYSDDVDAVDALRERIAGLEAERERIKSYNASCRKGSPDTSLLDEKQRADLVSTARACAWQIGKNGAAPAYWLTNLGGNINRNRKRLASLERDAATRDAGGRGRARMMQSRYAGRCADCGADFERGAVIAWHRLTKETVCETCAKS